MSKLTDLGPIEWTRPRIKDSKGRPYRVGIRRLQRQDAQARQILLTVPQQQQASIGDIVIRRSSTDPKVRAELKAAQKRRSQIATMTSRLFDMASEMMTAEARGQSDYDPERPEPPDPDKMLALARRLKKLKKKARQDERQHGVIERLFKVIPPGTTSQLDRGLMHDIAQAEQSEPPLRDDQAFLLEDPRGRRGILRRVFPLKTLPTPESPGELTGQEWRALNLVDPQNTGDIEATAEAMRVSVTPGTSDEVIETVSNAFIGSQTSSRVMRMPPKLQRVLQRALGEILPDATPQPVEPLPQTPQATRPSRLRRFWNWARGRG